LSTGSDFSFRPRLIPALASLALAALFVHLGLWQAGKAEVVEAQKALHAQRAQRPPQPIGATLVPAPELLDAPVTVEGEYEPGEQFYVDNRQEGGRPGIHVITPLRIKDSNTRVLINRGWVAWTQGRSVLPTVTTPTGLVRITGVAAVPVVKKPLLMSADKQQFARLWFAPDIARFASAHPYPVQPILVLQDPDDARDAFIRHWPPPEDRTLTHRGYALQWYGMTAVLFLFFIWSSFKRRPRPATP